MKNFKKILKNKTYFIEDGVELEKVRDLLVNNGEEGLLGYDNTYKLEEKVNKGYIHYDNIFFLSKKHKDKIVLKQLI